MKVETLGSFNFDVILCVGCVCAIWLNFCSDQCVCAIQNFSRSRIWHVSLTCCVYAPDSRHDWERFDICRSNSCRFREITEMLNWLKNINQSTPDVPISLNEKSRTFWIKISSVAQFNQRNFLFKENKENLSRCCSKSVFRFASPDDGPIPCDIWIQIYQTLLFTWLFRWPPGLLIKMNSLN